MPDLLLKTLAVLVLLGGLVFVHELGHFVVAKLLRVKVVKFSLGFGPRLLGFRRGETEYQIAALPLGGYVKMVGEDPTAEVAPEDQGRGFLEQAPWKRFLIAVAGPAMNLFLPFLLIGAALWSANGGKTLSATIGTVIPGSPAEQAGLVPGDRILSIAVAGQPARPIRWFQDLIETVVPHPDETLVLEVERGGKLLPPVTLRTGSDQQSNGLETTRRGIIGVAPFYTPARIAPVAPGAAGPLQAFDLVSVVNGEPVKDSVELSRALGAASCGAVDLDVYRERPERLPGVALAGFTRERLSGVPTCQDGKPSWRLVDPFVAAAIAAVEPGSPAERAGIRRGDVVTAVNGTPVHTFRELADLVNRELANAKPGTLTLADGRQVTLAAEKVSTLNEVTGNPETHWTVGLFPGREPLVDERALSVPAVTIQRGTAEVVALAGRQTVDQVRLMALGIVKLFSLEVNPRQMGSIIMIVEETGKAVEQGLGYFLTFMAFFSVNLALLNLLPIPVLDGGNIAQSLVEVITRRPLSLRTREIANLFGLIVLVSLIVFAVHNDIRRKIEQWRQPAVEETMR